MGVCSSKESQPRALDPKQVAGSRSIDSNLAQSKTLEARINKLLLLGAGESGKSTLFKQMLTLYGKGYSEEERKGFVPMIHNNIISTMKTLIEQAKDLDHPIDGSLDASVAAINDLRGDEPLTEQLAKHVRRLWRDEGVRGTFADRSLFQLSDSSEYFLGKSGTNEAGRIGSDQPNNCQSANYTPTQQDMLRCRIRTTGIVESEFVIEGQHFKLFDVGGQKNERKKWMHCFQNVTAVLFVTAISEYDQKMFEDETEPRMKDSLSIFQEICDKKKISAFEDTPIMLFLNKIDLFEEKLPRVPLTVCFPEYKGAADNVDQAVDYIKQQFLKLNGNKNRMIYCHPTCATDTDNVTFVFRSVTSIIINQAFKDSGLSMQ